MVEKGNLLRVLVREGLNEASNGITNHDSSLELMASNALRKMASSLGLYARYATVTFGGGGRHFWPFVFGFTTVRLKQVAIMPVRNEELFALLVSNAE